MWIGQNDTKTLLWMNLFCFVFADMKTHSFENALAWMGALGSDCFAWLGNWRSAPSSTIAGAKELYQQLLPTKVYQQKKTGLNSNSDITCRMCGEGQENMSRVLAGCTDLVQTKYLARHNAALKVWA